MTPNQSKILKFINTFWIEKDYSPSYKEIQEELKIPSLMTVAKNCRRLEQRGYITKIKHAKRSIDITDKGIEKLRRKDA
jgi:SOS-response transcriptional repressor LexA|tara:strand:+ start:337 stop:573 length:237 start_codon:yes stop_codon:yes gene_type:complete